MQNDTPEPDDGVEPGRALVPLAERMPACAGELPTAPFVAQLIEANRRPARLRKCRDPQHALARYARRSEAAPVPIQFERLA